ncbi:hypothetical protein [Lignipirellula cremea]|uniref:Uncharacterized protein n=1 Tax=Lignipirellula cremea TaxID=2528010 RepID=A0A518DMM1_9BACT|nr:hypothetical protein [Lignipirellula cremea]QDU93086.1 hypothetical protein Pla8534_08650 [Lignipirellula cremea]
MTETMHLFGIVRHVENPRIESGTFRFAPASIELHGQTWITLTDLPKSRPGHALLSASPNAPYFRGRLQKLFDFQQSPDNLECESWFDGKTCADRMMLNTTFVAETIQSGTLIQIPFVCTEQFGDGAICHGGLPERNTDRRLQLTSLMTTAFVDLLLASDHVDDYHDFAVTFGLRFEFGIRNGIPYNTLLKAHR